MSVKRKLKNGEVKNSSKNKRKRKIPTKVYLKNNVADLGKARSFGAIIDLANEKLEPEIAEEFVSFLEENAESIANPLFFKEKLRYGSPFLEKNQFMNDKGIPNPGVIPMDIFDKMKGDGQVAIGLAAIKQPVMSLKFTITCENKKQKVLVETALKPVWKQLLTNNLTAIDYGFSVSEKVWEIKELKIEERDPSEQKNEVLFSGSATVLKKLKSPYPGSIKFVFNKKTQEVEGLLQTGPMGGKDKKLRRNKFIIFTNEEHFGNVYGKSRLSYVYPFWYWSLIIYQFMLRYLERRGTPPTIVRHPSGVTVDPTDDTAEINNSDLALKLGNALLSNSVATLPSETDDQGKLMWSIEYLQEDPRQEMFIDVITHLNTMKLRALYVPERVLTQDFGTGSFAMADAHFNVHLQVQEGLISSLENCAQVLADEISNLNFTKEEQRELVLKIERLDFAKRTVKQQVMTQMIRTINNLARAGVLPRWVPDMRELGKDLEIPFKNVEDMFTSGVFPSASVGEKSSSDPNKSPESKVNKKENGDNINSSPAKAASEDFKPAPAEVDNMLIKIVEFIKINDENAILNAQRLGNTLEKVSENIMNQRVGDINIIMPEIEKSKVIKKVNRDKSGSTIVIEE